MALVNTRQRDENIKLPPAVKAQADKAQAAFDAAYKDPNTPPTEPPAEPPVEPPTEPPAEPPVQPQPPASEPPQSPPSEPPPAPPVTTEGNDQSWEHRYKSMEGRFARAEREKKDLLARIDSLQNVVATMQAAPPPSNPAQPAPAPAKPKYITEQDETEYGSDFLNVVGRKAKEELNPEVEQIKQQMASLQKRLEGMGTNFAVEARNRVFAALNQEVPNWRELNVDPKFLSWLDLPDAYSGTIRGELLKDAFDTNDTNRVLSFFKGFVTDEAATSPAQPGPGQQPGNPPAQKTPLATFAAPGRARTSAGGSPPVEKPIIRRADIAAFYAAVTAGKYRGREEEKAQAEAILFQAEREGRIVP